MPLQRHLSYINTPEPLVGRSRAAAVSFKDDSAALLPDASATFTIGQPTKTLSGSPQWQQVWLWLLSPCHCCTLQYLLTRIALPERHCNSCGNSCCLLHYHGCKTHCEFSLGNNAVYQQERPLQVLDTVQWKNPAVSALVLLLGAFCALAGEFILRGNHTVTPLKGEPFIFNPLRGNCELSAYSLLLVSRRGNPAWAHLQG